MINLPESLGNWKNRAYIEDCPILKGAVLTSDGRAAGTMCGGYEDESEFPEFCTLGDHIPACRRSGHAVPEPRTAAADAGHYLQPALE